MDQLRKRLDEIVKVPADAGADWLDKQINEIERLKELFPHNIELIQKATEETYQNCFAYALNMSFITKQDFLTGTPDSEFVELLILSGILLPLSSRRRGWCYSYIFKDSAGGSITHAGRKVGEKIVSKWGGGGTHIWKHSPLEVPARYGNHIKLYSPPARADLEREYVSWFG